MRRLLALVIVLSAPASVLTLDAQARPGSPARLGDVASRLSDDDIARIQRLAGNTAWLLVGHSPQFVPIWTVEVFLKPHTENSALRRGPMSWTWTKPVASDLRILPRETSVPRQWQTNDNWASLSWAQVALPGREFGDLRDEQDPNRPFRVIGTFQDTELLTLVAFIRSGVRVTARERDRSVSGALPIVEVSRQEDGLFEVQLRTSEWVREIVHVRTNGSAWSVVSTGTAID